jgi:hypothetical protein
MTSRPCSVANTKVADSLAWDIYTSIWKTRFLLSTMRSVKA